MNQAAVMLIVKDGLILGISRKNDKTKFGLIGGKTDPGETTKQTAVRETKEECNIDVIDCQLIFEREEAPHNPDGKWFYSYCYYAIEWEGEPQSSEEGEVKWLTAAELTDPNSAFPQYNTQALENFRRQYPEVKLI